MSASASTSGGRIVSLDQFRGYTVAGMFLVNFLGSYPLWVPEVLRHHHTYCSYADTIMPHFLFAVGFAFRLTFGRRVSHIGSTAAYTRVVRRLLGLILVAMVVYTVGRRAEFWDQLVELGVWGAVKEPLKRTWMQTLGQIAVTSLWILPVIRAGAAARILYLLGSAALHVYFSYIFYFMWVNTSPNGIDGGSLGFLTWTTPAIVGTLACDAVAGANGRAPIVKLLFWSALLMGAGYVMSCGTRYYDLSPEEVKNRKQQREIQNAAKGELGHKIGQLNKQLEAERAEIRKKEQQLAELRRQRLAERYEELRQQEEYQNTTMEQIGDEAERQLEQEETPDEMQELADEIESLKSNSQAKELKSQIDVLNNRLKSYPDLKLALDPVWPSAERLQDRDWSTLLAEPPFVPPPRDDERIAQPPYEDHRLWNYWMMTQRGGSLSYLTFSAGFSLAVFVLFYICCDLWGWQLGFFRTFGTNALAGYVLHEMVGSAVKPWIPRDAPMWYGLTGFFIFFALVYLFVRTLEKHKIYIKL